ncbi:conserved hypothetical protein [Desulfamplus magnetovallimortis]|uniref:GTPase domain-containing protein n=1 Tax=Desulfamplus magnetovallimortis TaxID=1246637 RepID=A0A1W1HF63_9BACT|nr:DUF697 domain-containing protein [Desulfamplus magnetovallimortis]SLM31110.1 conserved hypothetical protein [Desulfamplus magnetovallimortis]
MKKIFLEASSHDSSVKKSKTHNLLLFFQGNGGSGYSPHKDTPHTKKNINEASTKNTNKEEKTEMNTTKEKATDAKPEDNATTETAPMETDTAKRLDEANKIVRNRMIASVGAGLIPLPVVDIAALTGIQMDAVRALSKLYNVNFTQNIGKTAISALTGGIFPVASGPWVSSAVKTVPVVGQLMGTISMPVVAGASTYALGQVFIQHFESGGTFLTFDPEKVKEHFKQEFEKGKVFAKTEAKAI